MGANHQAYPLVSVSITAFTVTGFDAGFAIWGLNDTHAIFGYGLATIAGLGFGYAILVGLSFKGIASFGIVTSRCTLALVCSANSLAT